MRRFLFAPCLVACAVCAACEPPKGEHAKAQVPDAEPPEPIPAELPEPGPGPGPDCNLPPLRCPEDDPTCDEIVLFAPAKGPGYEDIPVDDETPANQTASYLRRDLMMLVQYAAAKVSCKTAGWAGTNAPLQLGDMSEREGDIPGTAAGMPGHPRGSHTNGHDIDLAYYQNGQTENRLRPICYHILNGVDQHHCVAPADWLDPWRTALFVGALFEHPRTRIVGVDGQVGPRLTVAIAHLCNGGWIPLDACLRVRLGYETEDTGRAWYRFHFAHMHVSFRPAVFLDDGDIKMEGSFR